MKKQKLKMPKPEPVKPSPYPDLFVYYRGQTAEGGIQENNILMHGVAPLVTTDDFAMVQNYILNLGKFVWVRIIYWQRAEGVSHPPKEEKKP